jgi:hypothetical protein
MTTRLSTKNQLLVSALALALGAPSGFADPPHDKGKGKGKHRGDDAPPPAAAPAAAPISINITFDQARRIAIDTGARGYKPLPPGIRKNLARGKPLPPGIAKQYAPAPMVARLPVHPGHEWRVVGTDLVLVAIATAIVVDVLLDVFS